MSKQSEHDEEVLRAYHANADRPEWQASLVRNYPSVFKNWKGVKDNGNVQKSGR